MTQLVKVTIDGVVSEVTQCNISEVVNRLYNVATFNIQTSPTLNVDITIEYGNKIFNGFIYAVSKESKLTHKAECRTYGAKLTEPFSPYTEGFDEAITSHDLCALYTTQSGIPINITSGNLSFGGSYQRQGTMLSALTNIANRTGAEFWDDGSSIQIQPNKAITEDGIEIPPSDIFDFAASKKTIFNKGVGFITVRDGGSVSNDIISQNNIYGEIEECTGEIFVYPNPIGEIEHSKGISTLSAISIERQETNNLLDQDIMRLDGAIKSVTSVTINGASVSDYKFVQGHNVIYFSTLKRGTITISYTAYAYKGYTNISVTPLGRFITFDLFYLDQVLLFQGFLSNNCLNVATDGDMTCIVPSEMMYPKGFDVYTIGGDPSFVFYNKDQVIVRSVASVLSTYTSIESATLEKEGGIYRYKTRYPITTDLEANSSGVAVSYTTSNDGDDYYFEFTQYYPQLKVSYTTTATKHTVQFSDIVGGVISMVIINGNTGDSCEYGLDGIDYDDMSAIPCILNQFVPIDIASELSLDVTAIRGVTLPYTYPSGSDVVTIDNFGIVKIFVDIDGDYVINTNTIKPRTTVTLTANVNG